MRTPPNTTVFYGSKPGSDGVWRVYVQDCVHKVVRTRQAKKSEIKDYIERIKEHRTNVDKVLLDHYKEDQDAR